MRIRCKHVRYLANQLGNKTKALRINSKPELFRQFEAVIETTSPDQSRDALVGSTR